ncbi:hypothetical protein WJX72_001128 [[Myrmecia] bisecta]|uniref:Uncharacterized protein n=1 Tax=[Myrmecia] bisecta TaxID=41462 RepID=A0AAW1R4Z9_9CHLO
MFDDHGEGGTFALYSLLCRHLGIIPGLSGKPTLEDRGLERYSVYPTRVQHEQCSPAARIRAFFRNSGAAQMVLLLVVVLMTSLVIGDGVLTPEQTVLGAFGAIQVKAPSFPQHSIAGIAMAVLAVIFLLQPLGTARIGFMYAPIVFLWFTFNIINGIHNIAVFYPAIFKVISPYYLYVFFRDHPTTAWQQGATIFLCLTGAEASYADLGHFSRPAIRLAFLGVLYPTVILTYFGQAAWLIKHPEGFATSFFLSVPWNTGDFWIVVKQSMALSCFPRMKMIHTSTKVTGQMWVPAAMVFMMAFAIGAARFFELLGRDPESNGLLETERHVPLRRLPGIGLLYTDHVGEEHAPTVLSVFVRRLHALPETTVLIKIRQMPVSSVSREERLIARAISGFPDMFEVVARYGYMDKVSQGPEFVADLVKQLELLGKVFDDEERERVTYTILDAKLKGTGTWYSFKRNFVDWIYAPFAQLVSVKTSETWGIPHDALIELGIIMPL